MKTTMRQRAREIIEEDSEVYGDNFSDYEPFLMMKIETCDEIIGILSKGNSIESCQNMCPFPQKEGVNHKDGRGGCCSCIYFCKGITANPRLCGCDLIYDGTITISQAINGLRIFKNEMKRYLRENSKVAMKRQQHEKP